MISYEDFTNLLGFSLIQEMDSDMSAEEAELFPEESHADAGEW